MYCDVLYSFQFAILHAQKDFPFFFSFLQFDCKYWKCIFSPTFLNYMLIYSVKHIYNIAVLFYLKKNITTCQVCRCAKCLHLHRQLKQPLKHALVADSLFVCFLFQFQSSCILVESLFKTVIQLSNSLNIFYLPTTHLSLALRLNIE